MAIRFYSWPRSSGSRVSWALEELGLDHEYVQLDRSKGEHKAPAYLAVNPNGKVPALVDGDEVYFESLAILLHLAEAYGVDRGLWPAAGPARAEALSWLVWASVDQHRFLMEHVYHGLDSPVSYAPDQRSKAAAEYTGKNVQAHLDMVENRLRGRDHLMGDFTLVDVNVASNLRTGTMFGLPLGDRPATAAWLARVSARPAVARVR